MNHIAVALRVRSQYPHTLVPMRAFQRAKHMLHGSPHLLSAGVMAACRLAHPRPNLGGPSHQPIRDPHRLKPGVASVSAKRRASLCNRFGSRRQLVLHLGLLQVHGPQLRGPHQFRVGFAPQAASSQIVPAGPGGPAPRSGLSGCRDREPRLASVAPAHPPACVD